MKLVFVSSTFKDMQFERDALHNLTAPKIDEGLSQYGETVYFGDLRWGVNTTDLDGEESSRRVLEVCLDEIDDCKPYMIVLIGERYGWIPDANLIKNAARDRGITVSDGISVTQLEIEYGALAGGLNDGRVLFYFRELDKTGMTEAELADYSAESDLHREKVELLKKRILELYPDRVRTYKAKWDSTAHAVTGLDGFLAQVEGDLAEVLTNDISSDMTLPWQERAIRSAHRYYMDNAKHYCPVERKTMDLFDGPFADEQHMLFIKGGVGSGKTAYISHLYKETVANEGEDSCIPFVLGLDKYSTTVMDYFKILLYKIEQRAGFKNHYETEYGVDGIDTGVIREIFSIVGLSGSMIHSYIDNCSFALQNALSVHLLDKPLRKAYYSYFNSKECELPFLDFAIAYSAAEQDVMLPPWFDFSKTVSLSKIKDEDTVPFVKALLKSKHKELADEVISAIAEKEEANRPTYLRLVVERLLMLDSRDFAEIRRMGDGMDNINRYQRLLIDRLPETSRGMASALTDSVAQRVDRDLVMRTLALLVYSGVTLSDDEIKDIFAANGWGFNSLDFSLATRSLTSVIKYNSREKTYSVTNPEVRDALTEQLAEAGYTYVADALLSFVPLGTPISTRLGEAGFNAASFVGGDVLALAIKMAYGEWRELSDKLYGMLKLHGSEYVADVLIDLVVSDTEHDYGFLLERIPTVCTTNANYSLYYDFLKQILDKIEPSDDEADIATNSFFTVAWSKFISFKMRVNASDAAPFYYALVDEGFGDCPMNKRARLIYEITRLSFTAKECYQTMSQKELADFDLLEVDKLIDGDSCPRDDEEHIFRIKLNNAFIDYVQRSFDLRYYDPDLIKDMRDSIIKMCEHIVGNIADFGTSMSSDDVAVMIDIVLSDKGEYSSISYKRVCTALDFMYTGQTYIDSKLNKYLPHILEAVRFSFDDEEKGGCDVPVNLYKRIVAYSRAVAGSSVTLDECLFAAINMGYAADVLADVDDLTGREYYSVLCDLRSFIRISLNVAPNDPRVLYRLYMPMRSLFVGLDLYGLDDEIRDFAGFLISLEMEDERAPLFPNIFIGSLVYAHAQKENEPLRLELREMRAEVEEDDSYASYRLAYAPEIMYIDIDLQSDEESNAAFSDMNISFADEDDLSGYSFDDGDDICLSGDDGDMSDVDRWGEPSDDVVEEVTPDIIRAMLEEQGISTEAFDDEMLMAIFGGEFIASNDDGYDPDENVKDSYDRDEDEEAEFDGIFGAGAAVGPTDGEDSSDALEDEEMMDIGMDDLNDIDSDD